MFLLGMQLNITSLLLRIRITFSNVIRQLEKLLENKSKAVLNLFIHSGYL